MRKLEVLPKGQRPPPTDAEISRMAERSRLMRLLDRRDEERRAAARERDRRRGPPPADQVPTPAPPGPRPVGPGTAADLLVEC